MSVIMLLGTCAVLLVATLCALALSARRHVDASVSGALLTLAGSTIGALGAVLVSTHTPPQSGEPPAPVVIHQPEDDPVPVAEA
jgi:hypothetical protein